MRLIAGLATLLSIVCFATEVSAHASLVATEPVDGSVVAQAPKTVRLRFNEPVTAVDVRLIDAGGRVRDDAVLDARGDVIEIKLPDNLPRGTEVVSYRVISADGHPVAGSIVFSIGMPSGQAAAPTEPASGRAALIWLFRIGVYLGLFAGVGGAFFGAWIAPPRASSKLIVAALIAGVLSAVASLGLQGLDVLDLAPGEIATLAPWKSAAATSLGPSMLIAVMAMLAGMLARRSGAVTVGRTLSALAMIGVGLSLAASGHAASASPQWLMRPMVFVHAVGVAFWTGALVPLVALAWRRDERLLVAVNRFSRAAVPVVGVLVLTGLVLAIVQLASFAALIGTNYGIILSVKIALVVVLLCFAALNRYRLTPQLARDPLNTRPIARSILIECIVVAAILALVAGWRFTPPPRALAASFRPPLAIHIHTDDAMFQVLISPGEVGTDNFVLQLMAGDASPLPAREATLTLSLPERGIEALERKATLGADGYWHVGGVPVPYPGRWHIRIEALVTDFQKVTLEDDFDVPAR